MGLTQEGYIINNIKDYREKELKWYIIASILILLYLSNPITIAYNTDEISLADKFFRLFDSGLIAGAICILSIIFDSLYSSDAKSRLVYFGQMAQLPAKTIFSNLKSSKWADVRFLRDDVLKKYSEVFEKMPKTEKDRLDYENRHWNAIYNKYRENPMIYISNRDYLLCRDLYITTITMSILYGLAISVSFFPFSLVFCIYLLGMLLLLNIATRIKSKRFVINVIAFDIHNTN